MYSGWELSKRESARPAQSSTPSGFVNHQLDLRASIARRRRSFFSATQKKPMVSPTGPAILTIPGSISLAMKRAYSDGLSRSTGSR